MIVNTMPFSSVNLKLILYNISFWAMLSYYIYCVYCRYIYSIYKITYTLKLCFDKHVINNVTNIDHHGEGNSSTAVESSPQYWDKDVTMPLSQYIVTSIAQCCAKSLKI